MARAVAGLWVLKLKCIMYFVKMYSIRVIASARKSSLTFSMCILFGVVLLPLASVTLGVLLPSVLFWCSDSVCIVLVS